MGTPLTQADVEAVIAVLNRWPAGTTLTWKSLLRRCEEYGVFSTRQTFWRHSEINLAFRTRKDTLRTERPPRSRESYLESENRALRAENARLRKENERFAEKFARWLYNAYKRGISEAELDAPMPRVDRRRSVSTR